MWTSQVAMGGSAKYPAGPESGAPRGAPAPNPEGGPLDSTQYLPRPVGIHVHRKDQLGGSFVARLHCGGLTPLRQLQTASSVCGTFCLEADTLADTRLEHDISPVSLLLAVFSAAVRRHFLLGFLMRFVSLGFRMHLPVAGSLFRLPPISASREKSRRLTLRTERSSAT